MKSPLCWRQSSMMWITLAEQTPFWSTRTTPWLCFTMIRKRIPRRDWLFFLQFLPDLVSPLLATLVFVVALVNERP